MEPLNLPQAVELEAMLQLKPAFGGLPPIRPPRADDPLPARCAGGPIPPDLLPLHDADFCAQLWQRLLAIVREPVQKIQVHGLQLVQVVGAAVIAVHPDGTMSVYLWSTTAPGQRDLQPLDPWTCALQGLPYRDLWLKLLASHAAVEFRAHAAVHDRTIDTDRALRYCEWLFEGFGKRLKRHADLRQMRHRIARELGVDRRVVAVAERVQLLSPVPGFVSVGAYNRVLRHRAAFDKLQREAPNLVPVFGALCDEKGFEAHGEPTARLKRFLINEADLTPRTWRLIAHSDGRLLKPLSEFYTGCPAQATLAHLSLLGVLGVSPRTPRWAVRRILGGWGDHGNRWESYVMDAWVRELAWQHVLRALEYFAVVPADVEAQFDLVRRWLMRDDDIEVFDKPQRAAGWQWLVRKASAWARRVELQLRDREPWHTWTETVQLQPWTLRPLNSPLQLWEEALAMHHCADIHESRCRGGEEVLFSVTQDGRRVATASIEADGSGWRLGQVKGFANRSAPPALVAAIKIWIEQYAIGSVAAADGLGGEDEVDEHHGCNDDEDEQDHVEDDGEEIDASEQARRIVDPAVAWVHGASGPEGDEYRYFRQVASWLEGQHDEGNLSYHHGGPQLLHSQVRDWTEDPEPWLDRLLECGHVDEERHTALGKRRKPLKALLPAEWAALDAMFVVDILSRDDPDSDRYGVWGAEQLVASDGRTAWAIYSVKG